MDSFTFHGSRTKSQWTKTHRTISKRTKSQEDKHPGGQNPRGTKAQGDKIQVRQKPRVTKAQGDKPTQGQKPMEDNIPGYRIPGGQNPIRFPQEWWICVLRPEKYMTIGTCLVMLRHPHPTSTYITLWNFTCCSEPFVLSPAPDANLILLLTRGARLGGATAQSPLGVLPLSSIRAIQHFFWKW